MYVLFSTYVLLGHVKPMVGLAVQALSAVAEEYDASVVTGVMPTGGWR
jgi:hypothetical protein